LLNYFKTNDPYRLIALFLILLLIRLPFMIVNPEMIGAELKWLLIGERLSEGGTLYIDVWDDIAPISAGFYWIMDLVFGRAVVAGLIISYLLVCYQSYIFNNLLIRNNIYPQSTYLPAFFYGMFMSSSFDMFYLSPPVIGMTFLIPALSNIFSHIQFRTDKAYQRKTT